jgi:hypothetical protein
LRAAGRRRATGVAQGRVRLVPLAWPASPARQSRRPRRLRSGYRASRYGYVQETVGGVPTGSSGRHRKRRALAHHCSWCSAVLPELLHHPPHTVAHKRNRPRHPSEEPPSSDRWRSKSRSSTGQAATVLFEEGHWGCPSRQPANRFRTKTLPGQAFLRPLTLVHTSYWRAPQKWVAALRFGASAPLCMERSTTRPSLFARRGASHGSTEGENWATR